jgi:hypothetical protein
MDHAMASGHKQAAVRKGTPNKRKAQLGAMSLRGIHFPSIPRWRKLASYSFQFVTLRFCFGMWWRRAALSLKGIEHPESVKRHASYPNRSRLTNGGSVRQRHS